MPQKSAADALHVAAAALGNVKYLLTLNCKHIANAHELPRIYELLDDREGLGQMLICTPAEFLGGDNDDDRIQFLMNYMPFANGCLPNPVARCPVSLPAFRLSKRHRDAPY